MKYSHLFLWSSTFCLLLSACQSGVPSLQPEIGSTVTPLTVTQTLVLTPTALPAPDGTFLAFLDAWNDHNFSGMYSLLTPLSQDASTESDFESSLQKLSADLTLTGIDYKLLSSFTQGETAQIQYRQTLKTALFGPIAANYVMDMHFANGRWGVAWVDTLIYPELTDGKQFYVESQMPSRGNIYDRSGKAFAAYTDAVAFWIQPGLIDPATETAMLRAVGAIVNRHPGEIAASYRGQPLDWLIPVGEASVEEVSANLDKLQGFAGLFLKRYPTRYYFGGEQAAAHAVGYMSYITKEELADFQKQGYRGDESVGRAGLERWGNDYLSGVRGGTLSIIDANKNLVKTLATSASKPAASIITTLDTELQRQTQAALLDMPAAAVVVELKTGAILAMASAPSFDPNWFDVTNPNSQWIGNALSNPNNPLINRVTQGLYPPGSVYKPFMAAAALESGLFTPEQTLYCGHYWDGLGPDAIKTDWTLTDGLPESGDINLAEAIMRSCNPWFYQIGQFLFRWDPNYFNEMSQLFGFGAGLTSIVGLRQDLHEEVGGLIPGPQWATENSTIWTEGDAVNAGIGQGKVLVTPLQMVMAYAALGNRGTLYQPQLVYAVRDVDGKPVYEMTPNPVRQITLKDSTWDVLWNGMWEVTHNYDGTAGWIVRRMGVKVPVYGKTGTAEDPPGLPHAWFAGFTQANDPNKPDIAIAVIVENKGEGSDWAAPIFVRIVEVYFSGQRKYYLPWEADYGLPYDLLPPTNTPDPNTRPTVPNDATPQP